LVSNESISMRVNNIDIYVNNLDMYINMKQNENENIINPMEQNPSWEAVILQSVKKFPTCYGTGRFITVFTRACNLFIFWARSVQSMTYHPLSWRSIFTFPHLHLCFEGACFFSVYSQNLACTSTLPHTCPAHLI
jgi:hypothetical protein